MVRAGLLDARIESGHGDGSNGGGITTQERRRAHPYSVVNDDGREGRREALRETPRANLHSVIIAGLEPASHSTTAHVTEWMPGSSPGMTTGEGSAG